MDIENSEIKTVKSLGTPINIREMRLSDLKLHSSLGIVVEKSSRGIGLGSELMERLVEFGAKRKFVRYI
jgi:GNAT superfamily N-acetyltransferase